MIIGVGIFLFFVLLVLFAFLIWQLFPAFKEIKLKPNTSIIKSKASELGISDKDLIENLGGMSKNYYELLSRVRAEESFKATIRSQIFAIISSIAAVIAALCAIYASFFVCK